MVDANQVEEHSASQELSQLSQVSDGQVIQQGLRTTSSTDNPAIDPVGEGTPLTVEEYLTNTTSTNDILIQGADPSTDFYGVGPASISQDIPLVCGEFSLYNVRNDSIESREVEEYTLHSTSFSNLYAQGFNVTSEFEHYYLTQFTIGRLVFFGGGGSLIVEVRNSTAGDLPSDEIFFTDSFAYGSLGEVTDISFVLTAPLLLRANHTYFVVVQTTNCDWYYVGDGGFGDGVDDGVGCHHDGNGWVVSQPAVPGSETIDFALEKITYQTAFFATEIGLTINGTQVGDTAFGDSVGGEVIEIYNPPIYPNSTGYFNFDLKVGPTFNVTLDMNCTLSYQWDLRQTYVPTYNVLNATEVNWNVTTDITVPTNVDLSRGSMTWYNFSFMLQDQNTDWNGTVVYDPVGTELTNFCEIQNGSYVHVTPEAIDSAATQDGDWTVYYVSPNFVFQLSISPVASLYNSSDTVTVTATLIDGSINSGTTLLNFTSPVGEVIYSQEGVVPSSGTLNFDPFLIPDEIADGNYTLLVLFEGDAETLNEIGFTCANITVNGLETPPVTTISPTDTTIQSTTSISLTADDGAGVGVDYTQYRIDGVAWVNYTAPFDFSAYGEGTYLVEFNSTDLNGNREQTKSITYLMDDTPPETTIEPANLAITSSTLINLTAVDIGGSDVDIIGYLIDDGAWLVYTGSLTLDAY